MSYFDAGVGAVTAGAGAASDGLTDAAAAPLEPSGLESAEAVGAGAAAVAVAVVGAGAAVVCFLSPFESKEIDAIETTSEGGFFAASDLK